MAVNSQGLLALAVFGAAWAYSRHRTALQHRVELESTSLGPTSSDAEALPGPSVPSGMVVHQSQVDTEKWGPVLYRVIYHVDGTRYQVLVRQPSTDAYEPITQGDGSPAVFLTVPDSVAFAESWISSADALTPSSPHPVVGQEAGAPASLRDFYQDARLPVAHSMLESMTPAAQGVMVSSRLRLTPEAQLAIFDGARRQMLSSRRSAPSVVARDVLGQLHPQGDWYGAPSREERSVLQDAAMLSHAAAQQVGFHPRGSRGLLSTPGQLGVIVGREWLGLREVDSMALPLGTIVELLIAEHGAGRGPLQHAERIFAEVIDTNRQTGGAQVRILDALGEVDVHPRFSPYHGYRGGQSIELRTTAPTGVRRVLQEVS